MKRFLSAFVTLAVIAGGVAAYFLTTEEIDTRQLSKALDVVSGRARSPAHEVRWLNLAGFCIRPGFGSALDVPPERQFIGLDAYRKAIDSGVDATGFLTLVAGWLETL